MWNSIISPKRELNRCACMTERQIMSKSLTEKKCAYKQKKPDPILLEISVHISRQRLLKVQERRVDLQRTLEG